MTNLKISGTHFTMNNNPIQLVSGAIHYFRIVPEYWRDRLVKLKACGFNTVETYVAWNIHEPEEGSFCFEGMADLVRFIETAAEVGLYVIVRPSPYICAEWEFGGLPAWLLRYPDLRLRCLDPLFLTKVDAYYDVLIPKLTPLLSTNGGPVIALQIENEYGSYGNDNLYLEHLRQGMISRGIDVLLFTSDGASDSCLQGGTLPDVFATVNFGTDPEGSFRKLKEYRPNEPLMCAELWNGGFDHWMKPHSTRDTEEVVEICEQIWGAGASVNFYMFHGGTNFGFYNGANHGAGAEAVYEPTVTSYDYDCPISESGEVTPKYHAVRNVLAKFMDIGDCQLPEPIPTQSYGAIRVTEKVSLMESLGTLSSPVVYPCPEPMEKLGQKYGFILYSTTVSGPRMGEELHLQEVHDRALVFLDGEFIGTVERWNPAPLKVDIPVGGAKLDILVENMGRINFGPYLKDYKGITEGVRLGYQYLFGWTIYPLPLDSLNSLKFKPIDKTGKSNEPNFYKATFEVETAADTFIRLDGWTKGNVWINGFHLGRYWNRGPQKTLYLPAPLLREGTNEIIIFELHSTDDFVIKLEDTADLGE
ncbi:glycoside hydrolase family 35 protein [Paenibacillus eucommiae]|uniref:Beta-galactosidase n=1 Tax=Paenibacillus eucommiae TaxID=1355755 RepID=A0ABS4JAH5_9BACL|nr:beta-galactosidase family protein [Paenibacillus eucommiae]MBP1996846.1 beta-galactosidase [Paenibacillus eucommiae]